MDIMDGDVAEHLKSRLIALSLDASSEAKVARDKLSESVNQHQDLYRLLNNNGMLEYAKHFLMTEDIAPRQFIRRLECGFQHTSFYIETIIILYNGEQVVHKQDISQELWSYLKDTNLDYLKRINVFDVKEMKQLQQEAIHVETYSELRGGIGNRLIAFTSNNLNSKDYREYSPAKELQKLADKNRSIIGDLKIAQQHQKDELDVYSKWINGINAEEQIYKSNGKSKKQRDKQAKRIIAKMNRTWDDDKYMELAGQLEKLLDLKEVNDEKNVIDHSFHDNFILKDNNNDTQTVKIMNNTTGEISYEYIHLLSYGDTIDIPYKMYEQIRQKTCLFNKNLLLVIQDGIPNKPKRPLPSFNYC